MATIGSSGIEVSQLCLGANVFGWTADRDMSFAVLDAFTAGGGNFVDTSDSYMWRVPGNSGGESETILGEWLASRGVRDRVVLATKVSSLERRRGLSAANIADAVDDSLRRLRTDRIDLYFAHRDDETVPQEETMSAFSALVTAGKVREVGASNFSPARLRSAVRIAAASGLTPYTVAQDRWNLVDRDAEIDLVPTVGELGMVEVPYSSLAGGFLTGKYRPGAEVASQRAHGASAHLRDPRARDLLDALDDVASEHRVGVAAVALAWLREQPHVAAPIASARTPEQVADLMQSAAVVLSRQELELLSATTEPVSA